MSALSRTSKAMLLNILPNHLCVRFVAGIPHKFTELKSYLEPEFCKDGLCSELIGDGGF